MNEGVNTTVLDHSGNGNHGSFVGFPVWTNGINGRALRFDGSNQAIKINHSAVLKPSEQITITAWIKASNITTNRYYEIYRKEDGSNRHLFSFQEYGTILSFGTPIDGGYAELDVNISANDYINKWKHVACSYNGNTKSIYANGNLLGSAGASGLIGTAGTSPVYIGCRANIDEFFNGTISDVRIFNRALTAQEISTLYHQNSSIIGV